MKRAKKLVIYLIFIIFTLSTLFIYDQYKYNDGKLHVIFCDVGQADAIFIRTPKSMDILVDGGYNDAVLNCLSENMPFWDRSLDAVFLTHPHSDHLGGLIHVLKSYEIRHFFTQDVDTGTSLEKLTNAIIKEKKINITRIGEGDFIQTKDNVKIVTVWPVKNQEVKKSVDLDKNGLSLIQLLTYGDFKLLLTGDAEEPVESKIAALVGDIDVLQVPHHGSLHAISLNFLNITSPELAVISVGKNNKYGLPNKSILDHLSNFKIKTLRTDQSGEVEIVSDGKVYRVNN